MCVCACVFFARLGLLKEVGKSGHRHATHPSFWKVSCVSDFSNGDLERLDIHCKRFVLTSNASFRLEGIHVSNLGGDKPCSCALD